MKQERKSVGVSSRPLLLACVCTFTIAIRGPLATLSAAECTVGTKWVPPTQVDCECVNRQCTFFKEEVDGYTTCSEGNSLSECLTVRVATGVGFICVQETDWVALTICLLGAPACVEVCSSPAVATPAGLAICLGCVTALGLGCSECNLINCTTATEGFAIYKNHVSQTVANCTPVY